MKFQNNNKLWLTSSIMFMSSMLIITLCVLGYYGVKSFTLINIESDKIVDDPSRHVDVTAIQNKNKALEQEINTLKSKPDIAPSYNNLLEALDYFRTNDFAECAGMLENVDKSLLTGYSLDKLAQLQKGLAGKAKKEFYDKGIAAASRKDFNTAAPLLAYALKYGATENFADDAAYFAANSYRELGDMEKAKSYAKILIHDYPDSSYVDKANGILQE